MNIKKRSIYAIIGLLILVIIGFVVNAAIMHSGHDFEVSIGGGNDVTLQDAISGDYFTGSHTYTLPSSIPDPGHSFDEIWVSVKDGEMYLLQALSSTNKLCPASPLRTSYSGPSDISKAYHYATEIEISPETSFQDIIDSGEFCCVENYGDSCPSGDSACINLGTVQCDGSCSGTYKSTATSCGTKDCDTLDTTCRDYHDVTQYCDGSGNCIIPECSSYTNTDKGIACGSDDWHACDGAGSCLGWEGIGCVACPWDSFSVYNDVFKGYAWYCILNTNQGRTYIANTGVPDWRSKGQTEWSYNQDAAACKIDSPYISPEFSLYAWQIKP